MKIEHITLGGSAVIRDTNTISNAVKNKLDGISGKTEKIWIPDLSFSLNITVTHEGCMFNIEKGSNIALLNVCCFDTKYKSLLISLIEKANYFGFDIIDPVTPNWLYTIMVNPLILSKNELALCGEIELYVYERIFAATNKDTKQ